jgi:hypothetical protein
MYRNFLRLGNRNLCHYSDDAFSNIWRHHNRLFKEFEREFEYLDRHWIK